ncbi:ribonuclease HI [Roseicella aquatilis]|uniref:Ribonuclease H n=1 Tax=Roseicella aquatilis TaxID=2527868 RepID=A0A4R4DVF4_9PROT|nr:ribonuclease HI [Roseicella aquatilis]TCZ64453.1 ribonuclease HI [Roseicella aquatilis]
MPLSFPATAADFGFAADPSPQQTTPAGLPLSFAAAPSGPFAVWTDGSCSPNPGPGGWAAILQAADGQTHSLSGAEPGATTNNRMELRAVIAALEALPQSSSLNVTVHTDSQYVQRGMTEWVAAWVRKGWHTGKGKPVENRDLWQALLAAAARHEVEWAWVRGHAEDAMNARVDALANAAREQGRSVQTGVTL